MTRFFRWLLGPKPFITVMKDGAGGFVFTSPRLTIAEAEEIALLARARVLPYHIAGVIPSRSCLSWKCDLPRAEGSMVCLRHKPGVLPETAPARKKSRAKPKPRKKAPPKAGARKKKPAPKKK